MLKLKFDVSGFALQERRVQWLCRLGQSMRKLSHMRKLLLTAACVLAVMVLTLGSSWAQQTSTPKPKTATASKTSTTGAKPKTATTPATSKPLTLTTEKQKLSYAIGMTIGEGMKKDAPDIDTAIVMQALKDALAGGKLLMTDEEAKGVMNSFRAEMIKKKQAEELRLSETNKQAGEKFLAENKAREGVVTLPDGLQYKIIKQGTGPKPTASDTVVTNYRGTLIDGTEFDSSYKRGQPATFPVGQVIKGWTEALQLMPVGSKWELYVPADLAYGQRSPGPEIGPNSTLIFDVELLSIENKDDKAKDKPQAQ